MSKVVLSGPEGDEVVDLKDPVAAAILGWLVPGLGHLYQRRTAKGVLFMVCILSTFFYGLFLSEGRAVYASWTDWDRRLPYLCQVGVGLPALPALLQTYLVRSGKVQNSLVHRGEAGALTTIVTGTGTFDELELFADALEPVRTSTTG